jgi:HNH endonuclease
MSRPASRDRFEDYDLSKSDLYRFWNKVNKSDEASCWTWKAAKHQISGYGFFRKNHRNLYAHRVSYVLHHGLIPNDLIVCHRCDNPPCINPAHLFLGTYKENADDMCRKGHNPKGITNGMSKLNGQAALAIRSAYSSGKSSIKALARQCGVTAGCIENVVRGRTWADPAYGRPSFRHRLLGENNPAAKFSDAEALQIKNEFGAGVSKTALAHNYGVSVQMIWHIVCKRQIGKEAGNARK